MSTVLSGLMLRDQLAAEMGCSLRTINRWETLGLPVVRLGSRRLYNPESVREWLMSLEHRRNTTHRGRSIAPSKRR